MSFYAEQTLTFAVPRYFLLLGRSKRSVLIKERGSPGSGPRGSLFNVTSPFRGALNNFQFTGNDLFIDKDVCSIVLEVSNSALGPKAVGLWARTVDGASGSWVQADRGARPSQSVFLPGDERDAYLTAAAADDARFIAVFAHSLEHIGGYSSEEARRVAGTLLPDIVRFDPTRAASYPSNGRALTDDVIDGFISILTNGKVTTDGAGSP